MDRPFPAYQGDDSFIFVSYSHNDKDRVYPFLEWLRNEGFNIWYDEGISPGASWREELAEAIMDCDLFLIMVSPRSATSEHCLKELNFALDQGRPILAIHQEETDFSPGLALSLSDRQAILQYELTADQFSIKVHKGISAYLPADRPGPQSNVTATAASNRKNFFIGGAVILCLTVFAGLLFDSARNPVDTNDQGAQFEEAAPEGAPPYSVAILPFSNIGGDEETGVFARGLSDDVAGFLSRNKGLKVASAKSVVLNSGQNESAQTITRELGVAYLFEGSVRRQGDAIRVNAQIIRGDDNFHVWSRSYTRAISEDFDSDVALARNIAHITSSEIGNDIFLQQAHEIYAGVEPEALQAMLESMNQFRLILLGEGGDWGLQEKLLKKAVAIDPSFTQAHTSLANAYLNRVGRSLSPREASPLAHASWKRAQELEPDPIESLLLQAIIHESLDLNYREASALFQRGVEQYPTVVGFHAGLGNIDFREGRVASAIQHLDTAIVLATDSAPAALPFLYLSQAMFYSCLEDFTAGLEMTTQAADLLLGGLNRALVLRVHAGMLAAQGKHQEARPFIYETLDLDRTHRERSAYLLAAIGERDFARQILDDFEDGATDQTEIALAYMHLGELDRSFKAMKTGIENHDVGLTLGLRACKIWDPIRGDSRFDQMLELLGSREQNTAAYLAGSTR